MRLIRKVTVVVFTVIMFGSGAVADLFYPESKLKSEVKKVEPKKKKTVKLVLNGIINGKEAVAIVNGRIMRVGDEMMGCKLKVINPRLKEVVFDCGGRKVKLKIDLLRSGK